MNEVQKNFRKEMGLPMNEEEEKIVGGIHLDDLILQRNMTDSQRIMFQSETSKVRKNRTTALLLTLFLGGLGAHHYYMGKVGLGVLYTCFCWTFIPSAVAFIELFFIMKRVDAYNEQMSQEVAAKVMALIN